MIRRHERRRHQLLVAAELDAQHAVVTRRTCNQAQRLAGMDEIVRTRQGIDPSQMQGGIPPKQDQAAIRQFQNAAERRLYTRARREQQIDMKGTCRRGCR